MQPDNETLDKLVQRILQVVRPLRIILFGSAARGDMGPDSDLDLLVVMPDGTDCKEATRLILRNLFSLDVAKDVVVTTRGVLERHRDNWSMIYFDALRHGKELYRAVA